MSDVKNIEVTTPVGAKKVVLRPFITGGMKRQLSQMSEDPGKYQEYLINNVIVSIDDATEDIVKKVDEMHGKDFDFIFLEITKIVNESSLNPEGEEKKA